jgi:hypothetical protein
MSLQKSKYVWIKFLKVFQIQRNNQNKNICVYNKITKKVVLKNEIYKWLGIWKMRDTWLNKLIISFINLFFVSIVLLPLFGAIILFINGVFKLNIPLI